MAINYLTYNGTSSSAYNIRVERYPNYSVPTRVVESITVPGRSGDLLLDTGAYTNFDRSYELYFNAKNNGFFSDASDVAKWLLGATGYNRLEDTYESDVFLMATVANQTDLRNFMNYMGRLTVTFNCKPQRWLKTGETESALTSGDTINNAYMPCFPIFKLTGNGTLNVNGNTVAISSNLNKTIVIDCETQNAYTGTQNRNSDISVSGDFPYLVSGANTITFNNASCSIIPRWWRL